MAIGTICPLRDCFAIVLEKTRDLSSPLIAEWIAESCNLFGGKIKMDDGK